jgi:hypothetical protein
MLNLEFKSNKLVQALNPQLCQFFCSRCIRFLVTGFRFSRLVGAWVRFRRPIAIVSGRRFSPSQFSSACSISCGAGLALIHAWHQLSPRDP